MEKDFYFRLIDAGVPSSCAAKTINYYLNFKTAEELEEYVRSIEEPRGVSDR